MTLKFTRYLSILTALALLSTSWHAVAGVDLSDYSDLGEVVAIAKNPEEQEKLLRIVEDEKVTTGYNREAVVEFIKRINTFPDVRLIGYKLVSKNRTLKNAYAGFAALEEIDKKLYVDLLFTAAGDRDKAWASVLSIYLKKQNNDNEIGFLPNEQLGTEWVEDFVNIHMKRRAASSPEPYKDSDTIRYNQIRLVQGLTFSYGPAKGAESQVFLPARRVLPLKTREACYASTRSPLAPYKKKPVIIFMTGEPGAGKNSVFAELKTNFPWLGDFREVDIDLWSEQNIHAALGGRNMSELAEEEKEELLKTAYARAWEDFVRVRDGLISEKKDIVLFVTGRQQNLIPEYDSLAAGKYRIVTFNISVTESGLIKRRTLARQEKTQRPVPDKFAQDCAVQIPIAQFIHEHLHKAASLNIVNNWQENKDVPLFFSSMSCPSNAPCDNDWRERIGEPTHWLRINLTEETRPRLDLELKAFVYGFNVQ
jgi:hypothetical protein